MNTPQLDVSFVRSTNDLEPVVAEIRSAGRFGLDTEFFRERTYFPRLCLAQIATPRHIYLLDPVAGCDVRGIGQLLADPTVEAVLHAARQDLQLFYELSGHIPKRLFDVQLAAAFAGYGASPPYGRLVHEVLGVALEKGEAYTDWCRRPLTQAQLAYAADDVRYLLPMADQLRDKLDRLGRTEWVAEEMRLLEDPDTYAGNEEELYRKVAGQGNLSPRHTAILRELARWRDQTAAERDIPRGWLVKDPTLIEIARREPATIGDLKTIRGLDVREAERSGAAILRAIVEGKKAPPIEHAFRPAKSVQARARMVAGPADAIVRARAEHAGIAPEMVVTRAELDALLIELFSGKLEDGEHRLLTGWRRDLAGEAVLALATGKTALRAIDQPPYIEEIPVG